MKRKKKGGKKSVLKGEKYWNTNRIRCEEREEKKKDLRSGPDGAAADLQRW